MKKRLFLFPVLCTCLFVFPTRSEADSIDRFDVNALFFHLDLKGTLEVDVTSGNVISFSGDLLVPPDSFPLDIPKSVEVPVTGGACQGVVPAGCLFWGGSFDGFGFLAGDILSCSGFVGFQGGALPPTGCSQFDFLHITLLSTGAEIGGASLSGGSVTLVPEPASALLVATGLLGLVGLRRRNKIHV